MNRRVSSLVLAAVFGVVPFARADMPASTQPATQPAAANEPSPQDLMKEIRASEMAIGKLFPKPADLADPAKRTAAGPEAVALLRKILPQIDALAKTRPGSGPQLAEAKASYEALLVALGDEPTKAQLAAEAQGADAVVASRAKRTTIQGAWYAAGPDAAAQAKLVDQIEALGKADPSDAPLTMLAVRLGHTAAAPELGIRLETLVSDTMKNPVADRVKASQQAANKIKSTENKPLAIAGKLVDGKDFTTADWKGKVVLVDFWATWCGPCKEELPRVKKAYADFHDKGLEVLGVSNDYGAEALKTYTAAQNMPWPELFDPAAAADHSWNPTTLGFGINGIPTMFLIDKKGVCRTVTARENFEEMIPKLLAE